MKGQHLLCWPFFYPLLYRDDKIMSFTDI